MAASKQYDLRVEGLNELLRSFRKLGPEAQKELRTASKKIAQNRMVPAYQAAALNYGGPWGQVLADSVKAGSDRLPKVMIGGARRRFSGGAGRRRSSPWVGGRFRLLRNRRVPAPRVRRS